MDEIPTWYPNPTPQHETVVNDDPAFVEACMARIAEDVERQGWRLGKSIVTRSKEWGLVWRVDFEIQGGPYGSNRVDRVICWRSPDSEDIGLAVVFGKHIDKLA
jgi:hypothetical protein